MFPSPQSTDGLSKWGYGQWRPQHHEVSNESYNTWGEDGKGEGDTILKTFHISELLYVWEGKV